MTEQAVAAENYPFCTIDPNESRCPVPDQRFDWLCELWQSPSKIPAYLMVTDIAGIIKGAHSGAGLGNAFLSHIAAVDGIYHVVRAFENPEVVHVDDSVDPIRDLETIVYELCRKDAALLDAVRAKKELEIKYVYIHMNTYIHTCIHMHTHAYTYIHMHIHIDTHIHI